MKTMLEYIAEAQDLLMSNFGSPKASDLRAYLTKHLSDWTIEEQDDLLTLCAAFAHWGASDADEAVRRMEHPGREYAEMARKTSVAIGRFSTMATDKRETERRREVIERHFGSALRRQPLDQGDDT